MLFQWLSSAICKTYLVGLTGTYWSYFDWLLLTNFFNQQQMVPDQEMEPLTLVFLAGSVSFFAGGRFLATPPQAVKADAAADEGAVDWMAAAAAPQLLLRLGDQPRRR